MILSMFLILGITVFLVQTVFCFCAQKLWIKLLPIVLFSAADAFCWLSYFLGTFSDVYGGDFAAFIYGIVLLIMVAVSGLSWGIYGIVKLVQNRRK